MGVWINSTGDNQLPTRIKESVWSSRDAVKVSPNERHGLAVNQDVGGIRVDGRDDMPAFDKRFHRGKLYDTTLPE
jgi:hypothetical protein